MIPEISVERSEHHARVRVRGRVDVAGAGALWRALEAALGSEPPDVGLDLSGVSYFDTAGGAVLVQLRRALEARGGALRIEASRPEIDALLALIDPALASVEAPRPTRAPVGARLRATVGQWVARGQDVVAFVGEIVLGLVDAVAHPRRVRWRETLVEIQRAGADSLPIVALISFLVGLITAFQASIQLKQFGADIYVANLVGLSMGRELGPLMTAIIASGRSGAAYAAEIGTMKVAEEIDALVTLGLDRTRFLVTPKVTALVLMLPCLTVLSDLIGMLGGMIVADLWLDMAPGTFLRQLQWAMYARDLWSGLVKSVVFGAIVAGVGCHQGLRARGGAESVGQVTTAAVVVGITLIIAADAVFTYLFYAWGI